MFFWKKKNLKAEKLILINNFIWFNITLVYINLYKIIQYYGLSF